MSQKYAQLLLKTGIAFREGRCLLIRAEPIHWDLACAIEAEAYKMGAKLVDFELVHPLSAVNRSLHQRDEYLEYFPGFFRNKAEEMTEQGWSFLRLDGMENPDLAKQINQKRNAVTYKAQRQITKPLTAAMMRGKCPWCIGAVPTDGWAKQIGLKNRQELWDILVPILRLDEEDPSAAWKKHSETLLDRCRKLNEQQVEYLHFLGQGTDLRVHLNPLAEFQAAGSPLEDGSVVIPNLPTEEVYTAPDYRKTEGRVRVTRPVNVLGDQVKDAWFEFNKGRLIEYGASYGKHLLDEFVGMDPKARFLGEVALVDATSPIFRSGRIFNSILLDENAACHIALGCGITGSIKGYQDKSEDDLDALGCNKSLLHTDFMIGSEEINVTARLQSGKDWAVIRDGRFVI